VSSIILKRSLSVTAAFVFRIRLRRSEFMALPFYFSLLLCCDSGMKGNACTG